MIGVREAWDDDNRREAMKFRAFVIAVAMVAGAGVGYAGVPEKKVSLKDLPPAVKATVEAESKGATVKGISSEKADGKTVYELETLVNGRTRDLMIDSAGKVYVLEEQLDVDKAPAPVRTALEKQGKILALESVQENGKTRYEGQVQTKAGKKVAVELNADGTPFKK
jgi:uncharacterized membrane protein YkoI